MARFSRHFMKSPMVCLQILGNPPKIHQNSGIYHDFSILFERYLDLFGDIPPFSSRLFPCETPHLGLVLVHDAKNTRRNPSQGISKWILKGLAAGAPHHVRSMVFGDPYRDPYVDLVGGAITILKNVSSSMGRMTSHI